MPDGQADDAPPVSGRRQRHGRQLRINGAHVGAGWAGNDLAAAVHGRERDHPDPVLRHAQTPQNGFRHPRLPPQKIGNPGRVLRAADHNNPLRTKGQGSQHHLQPDAGDLLHL